MHVAYIHQHFSTHKGATGTRSYEMSRRLIAAGHRVTMVCGAFELGGTEPGNASEKVSQSQIDGIGVLRVNEPYANRMSFTRRIIAFGRFARTAAKLVSRLDADLVFATSTPLTVGIPGMKAARKLKVPFVFEVRDLWPELPIALGIVKNPLLKWYTRRLERKIYFAADHIIALAPGIREGITATGYPLTKTSMIPNGCDLELFQPSKEPLDDPRFGDRGDFRLVFTGAHGLANGLDAVLDAALELQRRGVRGIRFVFLGEGGQRDRLMKRSHEQGLDDWTVWLKAIPKTELARVLPRMDVGLMILKNVPAFYFGTSPNKFFDYIACGLPVLNNYPGWLAGLITEHQCGLALSPDDPKAFADAVLKLRDDREESIRMGARGRRLAESQFSRDLLGQQFVTALESVRSQH